MNDKWKGRARIAGRLSAGSPMNSQIAPKLLDYAQASSHRWKARFIAALVLGIAQLPWIAAVGFRIAEWQSLRPVVLWRDSLLALLSVTLTIPAIVTSAIAARSAMKAGHTMLGVICVVILGGSVLLLGSATSDWYQGVYLGQNQSWGLW